MRNQIRAWAIAGGFVLIAVLVWQANRGGGQYIPHLEREQKVDQELVTMRNALEELKKFVTTAAASPSVGGPGTPTRTVPKRFAIMNAATGQYIGILPHQVLVNGAEIVQSKWQGSPHQEWYFIEVANGVFRIENVASRKVIDMHKPDAVSGASPALVRQWAYHNGSEQCQHWTITGTDRGCLKIKNLGGGGQLLEIPAALADEQVASHGWKDVGEPQQEWKLIPLE